jgi:hypothetical protein
MLTKTGSTVYLKHPISNSDFESIDDEHKELLFVFNDENSLVNDIKLFETEVSYDTIPFLLKKVAIVHEEDDLDAGPTKVYYSYENNGLLIDINNDRYIIHDIRYKKRIVKKYLVVWVAKDENPDLFVARLDGFSLNLTTTLFMDRLITMVQYENSTFHRITAGLSISRSNKMYPYSYSRSIQSESSALTETIAVKNDLVNDVVRKNGLIFEIGAGSISVSNEAVESIYAHKVDMMSSNYPMLEFADIVVILDKPLFEGVFSIQNGATGTSINARIGTTQQPFEAVNIGKTNDVEIETVSENGNLTRRITNKSETMITISVTLPVSRHRELNISNAHHMNPPAIRGNNVIFTIVPKDRKDVSIKVNREINIY